MNILLKRTTEAPARGDGARVLVDRLWPRGKSKEALKLDLWLRDAAPSTELRQWFGHDPAKWAEFRRRYHAELDANAAALAPLRELLGARTVTLLFAAADTEHNNAVALREWLLRAHKH
ncbi:MAG: DUF488 family protein [Mizugakiibacter sp.]|uniref:DUF488 domain-containing protein n=1 Tax=Mizugakiibacter sp. TaxID=1972610 RepID=UPI0031BE7ABB|nr:DUF488 family protein [Xanthomonadaceae bacterium]